ncbi:hypothetical protein HKBW3S42_00738 [Candidatus Hakubella thermalkaliphila]|uniref:Uncharacterized protein n=1 Tax=Candidatus Hakubella thermalkaliphila TaxID=2754717 RepID=A0A6V8PL21_9ACTN|nr:hypothetical protein HKBW3S42_00738 [Candidatus Hakubella thermalkaliphila]
MDGEGLEGRSDKDISHSIYPISQRIDPDQAVHPGGEVADGKHGPGKEEHGHEEEVHRKLSVNPVATRKCGVPGGSACEGDRGRCPSPGVGNGCVDPAFPALGSVRPGSIM